MVSDHHRTTFRLFRHEPVVSRPAVRQLAALERALQVKLPASIREWYSLVGAVEHLNLEGDLHFEPWTIDENARRLKTALARQLPFRWVVGDYSSGVGFTAAFTGSDPVVRCVETDGSFIAGTDEWIDRPFSAFVFTCCWHKARERAATVGGLDPVFGPAHLELLGCLFEAGPHVRRGDSPPEATNPYTGEAMPVYRFRYFFFGPEGGVYIAARDDPTVSASPAIWELISPDEPGLRVLSARLNTAGLFRGPGRG